MKITATQYNVAATINKSGAADQTQATAQGEMKIERATAVDPVLGSAQSELSALPEVDQEHVAEVKAAIQRGEISVNLDQLTVAMQKYYQR